MKILFISNGHGEDIIAARMIKELAGQDISVMPLVGAGTAFDGMDVKILGPRKKMPSGGFVYQSLLNIVKDLTSGLISNSIAQIKELRSLKGKFDLVVSVGDIIPIIGALQTRTKFVFIGCAKSDYYNYSYTAWEKHFLRKYCAACFPRDRKTDEDLVKAGIKSRYIGNPMMDCMEITGADLGTEKESIVIGVLPGTRDDAAINMEDITKIAVELNKIAGSKEKKLEFLVAAAASVDTTNFAATKNMRIIKGMFGDILNRSDIVIGLSGTGNEQAAGLGKPVVSFPGRGVQYTALFAKRQKELLNGALLITDRDPSSSAAQIWTLLEDKEMMKEMGDPEKKGWALRVQAARSPA